MAFKTGGYKTKYFCSNGYSYDEYTIYAALESVSDVISFRMYDNEGNEEDICIGATDDLDYGKRSLIDCLYALRHRTEVGDIVIERMTNEEMEKIFR